MADETMGELRQGRATCVRCATQQWRGSGGREGDDELLGMPGLRAACDGALVRVLRTLLEVLRGEE